MDKITQKIPKDHYVPQFYLNAFASDGLHDKPHIFQYSLDNIIVNPRIKDVAGEKHFNTVKHKETGDAIRDIDDFYTQAENISAVIIKKIMKNEEINLTDAEFSDLSFFIALLATRTPGFINGMQSMQEESIKELLAVGAGDIELLRERLKKAGMAVSEETLIEYQKHLLERQYSIKFGNRGAFLVKGLKAVDDIAKYFYEKHWHLLVSDSERVFITSDHPVSIYRPKYIPPIMGAGYANGTILMPISPKLAILLRDIPHKKLKLKLNNRLVDEFNENTMKFSTDYIFSNLKSKQIDQRYKKVGNKSFQKIQSQRIKGTPYVRFGPPPIPQEPSFLTGN